MKNCTYFYLDGIIKTEDFDFGNILLVKKPYKNTLIYNILCKTLIVQNDCVLGSIKIIFDNWLYFLIELDIYYYLVQKNTFSFAIGLDIL